MIVYPMYDAAELCLAMLFGGCLGAAVVFFALWGSLRKGGVE